MDGISYSQEHNQPRKHPAAFLVFVMQDSGINGDSSYVSLGSHRLYACMPVSQTG